MCVCVHACMFTCSCYRSVRGAVMTGNFMGNNGYFGIVARAGGLRVFRVCGQPAIFVDALTGGRHLCMLVRVCASSTGGTSTKFIDLEQSWTRTWNHRHPLVCVLCVADKWTGWSVCAREGTGCGRMWSRVPRLMHSIRCVCWMIDWN